MPPWLMSAVRTAVQSGWGVFAAWAAARGLGVPDDVPPWVLGVALAAVTGAVTAVIRWLETRRWMWARRVGRVLMLGIVRQPGAYTGGSVGPQR